MPVADIDFREYYPPEKIEEYASVFSKFDTDNNGALNEVEVAAMFRKIGKQLPRQHMRELIKEVDVNETGLVYFEELCVMDIKMSRLRPRPGLINYKEYLDAKTIAKLEHAFVQNDPFGRGALGLTELFRIFEMVGCNAPQEEIEAAMQDVDPDGSSELGFTMVCALFAVLARRRKRLNYREFLTTEQVWSYRKMFRQAVQLEAAGHSGQDWSGGGCDDGGRIGRTELDQLFRRCGIVLKKHQMKALFDDFDVSGSGTIDFEDFCVMMLRIRAQRRVRDINPSTHNCWSLWKEEQFSIKELQQSGFTLLDFKKVGIPVGSIFRESGASVLELRRAGYTPTELRKGGVGALELRACGFSLADMRNAGFSDFCLQSVNRKLRSTLSVGDLSALPQQRPLHANSSLGNFPRFQPGTTCPLGPIPPRQMTPMLREHTDWRSNLSLSDGGRAMAPLKRLDVNDRGIGDPWIGELLMAARQHQALPKIGGGQAVAPETDSFGVSAAGPTSPTTKIDNKFGSGL